MLSHADQAAVRAFPVLHRLIELRQRPGWVFMPKVVDGEVTAIEGICAWPQGCADMIRIEDLTDAAAERVDHTGAVTWTHDGTLDSVISLIIEELGSPDDRWAPRLVRGFAEPAPGLWRPS